MELGRVGISPTFDRDAVIPFDRLRAGLAVGAWTLFAAGISLYVATHPGQRTVTPTYRIAADAWFAGGRLYNVGDIGGFLYFPQAALLYVPFMALPHAVGEIAWRLCGIALLAWGMWRLAGLIDANDRGRVFALFTLLCLPATLSAARNGQMNLHLAGLMLHATADVATGVWWRAAFALTLGLALKPHAIVAVLLAGAVYPRTRGWFVLFITAAAASLFLFQRPGYVIDQYVACLRRIAVASMPPTDTWSDLRGLLLRLGVDVSNRLLIAVRLAAAVPTLMLALAARRFGALWSAVYVFALGAVYLMIFNPRNEANTYVILAPAVAALAARAAIEGRTVAVWTLAAYAIALGCENYGRTIFRITDLWFKPLLTIGFAGYLVREISAGPVRRAGATAERLRNGLTEQTN